MASDAAQRGWAPIPLVGQSEPRGPHLFGAGYAPFCKAGNRLTGSAADIASVARAYHVFYEKVPTSGGYTMNHTATVFLMDRRGALAGTTNHEESEAVQLNKLRRLLTR